MTKDIRMEETSKFAALPGCTYNDEVCFIGVEPKYVVCHPARYITETATKLFKGKNRVCCRCIYVYSAVICIQMMVEFVARNKLSLVAWYTE